MKLVNERMPYLLFLSINLFTLRGVRASQLQPKRKAGTTAGQAAGQLDLGKHVAYVSPLPGAKYLTPGTNMIVRSDENVSAAAVQGSDLFNVRGSESGVHSGETILVNDDRTILFQPAAPFRLGETVTVSFNHPLLTESGDSVSLHPYTFTISKSNLNSNRAFVAGMRKYEFPGLFSPPIASVQERAGSRTITGIDSSVDSAGTLPADFPVLTVTKSDNPTPGYLFMASIHPVSGSAYGYYNMIVDNHGNPVYYKSLGTHKPFDFNLQPTGVVTYSDAQTGEHYIMNTSLKIIDSVSCGNGYANNPHELRALPDGRYFLLADDYEKMDLSKIVPGGDTAATVIDNVIQEVDKNGNVIFQWRGLDHFKITDAIGQPLTGSPVDFEHANAIEIDPDGTLLLSSRYFSEITKIDTTTGDIIWRLGGKNNQFTFVNDTIGFSYQHSVRTLPNGDVTLFDDGDLHNPQFSRAVEYKLDEAAKTATLVWQFRHNPDVYGSAMGYVQRLSDGSTLIGWGQSNLAVTEVRPDGSTALEMAFPKSVSSYRVYRYPFLFITVPFASDTLEAGTLSTIRWKSSGVDSVDAAYSVNGGTSWVSIANNYPADNDSLNWTVPRISDGYCTVKLTESGVNDMGLSFNSDSVLVANVLAEENRPHVTHAFSLSNNYPNPFNPSTTIGFTLKEQSRVRLEVFNILGQEVQGFDLGDLAEGIYSRKIDMASFSSGVYFYRIDAVGRDGQAFSAVKKMVLMK